MYDIIRSIRERWADNFVQGSMVDLFPSRVNSVFSIVVTGGGGCFETCKKCELYLMIMMMIRAVIIFSHYAECFTRIKHYFQRECPSIFIHLTDGETKLQKIELASVWGLCNS